jgi:hypothetical protein
MLTPMKTLWIGGLIVAILLVVGVLLALPLFRKDWASGFKPNDFERIPEVYRDIERAQTIRLAALGAAILAAISGIALIFV